MPTSSEPTSCPDARELAHLLETGAGDADIALHVRACPACAAEFESMRENNALMRRLIRTCRQTDRAEVDSMHFSRTIPGYEIIEPIERGGQGAVYRALQLAAKRIVALKVLHGGALATSRQRSRFDREIELAASLDHPAIVAIFDSGVTAAGDRYFAMQFIDGQPLDEWANGVRSDSSLSQRQRLERLLNVFIEMTAGVHAAHQRGVIHRDLKPANVLIDASDQPHILDFGIARSLAEDFQTSGARATLAGAFLGTLAYAAPEQLLGANDRIDTRSDIYGLGVLLYQMMTGRLPHSAEAGPAAMLQSISQGEPISPHHQSNRDFRSEWNDDGPCRSANLRVDRDLEAIMFRALAREPDDRYATAMSFRADVLRYLDGDAVDARHASGWYALRKIMKRHRTPTILGAAFVLLIVSFLAVTLFQKQRISREAAKLAQINLFLEDTLGSVQREGTGDVSVGALLDEARQWIDIALADQPEVAASIRTTIGNSYRSLGRFDGADALLTAALDERRRLHGDRHRDVAQSLNALGLLRRDQGRFDEAIALLTESLAQRRELIGANSYPVSLTLNNLAITYRDQGDLDEAKRLLESSLRIRRALFAEPHSDIAMCLFNLAIIAERRGELREAETLHRAALEQRRAVLHSHHPDISRSLDAMTKVLHQLGKHDEADELLRESSR